MPQFNNKEIWTYKNIFVEKELIKDDTMTKSGNSGFAMKPTNYYNLDMINMGTNID